MTMLNFTPLSDYDKALLRLLKAFEAPHADARDVGDGKITIGLGFNLNAKREVRSAVINKLLDGYQGTGTAAQVELEEKYKSRLDETITSSTLTVSQKLANLNSIMAERAGNTALNAYAINRRTSFAFSSNPATMNTEVDSVFNVTVKALYEVDLKSVFPALKATSSDYVAGFATSREHAVLFSFVYNGGSGLIGSSLKAAITSGDRARAWYEIRYQSNKLGWAQINGTANAAQLIEIGKGIDGGLAKRRDFESQVFGLYASSTANDAEAKDTFRMVTQFRTEIFKYENAYGTQRDGSNGSRGDKVASAIDDFLAVQDIAKAQPLIAALLPAKDWLVSNLASRFPEYAGQLADTNFLATNVYLAKSGLAANFDSAAFETGAFTASNKNDLMVGDSQGDVLRGNQGNDAVFGEGGDDYLEGGAGVDLLVGGLGNDRLDGGAGDNTLDGGDGDDTYVIDLRDGVQHNRIIDSDGKGRIVVIKANGEVINTQVLQKQGTTETWADKDGQATITHNSPWKITLSDGSVIELGDTFDPLGFGISLQDKPDDTTTSSSGDFLKKIDPAHPTSYLTSNGNYVDGGVQANANDLITGTAAADLLKGLGGNDGLSGGVGDDVIEGGDGDDLLLGALGADSLSGGAGKDFIFGSGQGSFSYPTSIDAAAPVALGPEYTRGFSWVTYDAGIDANGIRNYQILGGLGSNVANDEGNVIDGGAGDDWIRAGSGADVVHGGDDKDNIDGLAGNDVLFGDAGDDNLRGDGIDLAGYLESVPGPQHGNDILDGGAGKDSLTGQGGDDELYGGTEDDQLWGDDTDTKSTPLANHGNDYLDGGDGADQLSGGGKNDVLYGGIANDTMFGDGAFNVLDGQYHGQDYLDGEDGDDYLEGGGEVDNLYGGAGNDTLWGDASATGLKTAEYGTDYLDGEAGNDTLFGGGKGDTMYGGEGDDQLKGDDSLVAETDQGGDYLDGENGNDRLIGDAKNDTLFGGVGNDTLWGDADAAGDLSADGNGNDSLDGEEGEDVLIGGGKADTLFGGDGNDGLQGDGDLIANADGGDDYLDGGAGNDTLMGDGGNDLLVGGEGINTLTGGAGNDSLIGGSESDQLLGDDFIAQLASGLHGQDDLDGGGGDDVIAGGGGSDVLRGGDGNDWLAGEDQESIYAVSTLTGDDTLFGGAGDDILLGGAGADQLFGEDGNDTFNAGTGNDILDGGAGSDTLMGGDGVDTYQFGIGSGVDIIINGDADAQGASPDTVLLGAGITTANITLQRPDPFAVNGSLVIGVAGTADSLTISEYFIQDGASTTAVEFIKFSDGVIWSLADVRARLTTASPGGGLLYGFESADTLTGAQGADNLSGLGGADSLYGGSGNDTLSGGSGNDRLDGGTGDDSMVGGQGADTYVFARGTGSDQVDNQDTDPSGAGTLQDVVEMGSGILPTDVTLTRTTTNDLVISIKNSSERLLVWKNFVVSSSGSFGIDAINFANGAVWNASDILAQTSGAATYGTPANDTMVGTAGPDQLLGLAGDDNIQGGLGDDILEGGLGNDMIDGGTGNDAYVFKLGDGADAITDYSNGYGSVDELRFGPGISPNDITALRSGNDLTFNHVNGLDKITVKNWFSDGSRFYQLEQIKFNDGTTWISTQINTVALEVFGTAGADTLAGTGAFSDTLHGLAGNDSLTALGYLDTLDGGDGDDTLTGYSGGDKTTYIGGKGNDTITGTDANSIYVFNMGDGADTVTDYDSNPYRHSYVDELRFGAGILSSDVIPFLSGDDVIFKLKNGVDQITFKGWYANNNESNQVEKVVFSDAIWTLSAGDIFFRTQTEIIGTSGADSLIGGYYLDTLRGLAGNDTLTADGRDDTLEGGTGNDVLIGSGDNNGYLFNLGDGVDTIDDWGGVDELRFGAGVSSSGITTLHVGNDLILKHSNGTDQITITGWFADGGAHRIEQIKFSDTTWTAEQITAPFLLVTGTAGPDSLVGTSFADTLRGLAGNDTLTAVGGGDTLEGGDGNDVLNATDTGYEVTIFGGKGNDTINGSGARDIYIFNAGDGADTIDVYSDGAHINSARLQFGAGISSTDVTAIRSGGNLVLKHINGTDQVTFNGWFYAGSGGKQVASIQFSDTTWTADQVTAGLLVTTGTSGADSLVGTAFADTLRGLAGNDTLIGGYSDTLEGGDGNDTLRAPGSNDSTLANITFNGGKGDDTIISTYSFSDVYLFSVGDGADTITDYDNRSNYYIFDEVRFGSGILSTDINLSRSGNDLLLRHLNGTDKLTIKNWFSAVENRLDQFKFSDATWTSQQINARVLEILGTAGANNLIGLNVDMAETVRGLAGNDTLTANGIYDVLDGGDGNDVLIGSPSGSFITFIGGKGDDSFTGSYGDDSYVFNLGDGADTITENGGADDLRFGSGIVAADISVFHAGADLIIKHSNGVDQITVKNWFTNTANQIELIKFSDKTTWTAETVTAMAVTQPFGTSGNDIISGTVSDDVISSLSGNDVIDALAGNDRLDGGAGSDTLRGGAGDDIYVVDDLADTVTELVNEGRDKVLASVTWTLGSNTEDLTLTGLSAINGTGNELDNVLRGNDAGNILTGAVGSDTLIGGLGDDIYRVDSAGDVITEGVNAGTDGVESELSYTLAADLENLTLVGTLAINATGNSSVNRLLGNTAANRLDGSYAADVMIGGAGDDTYVVDNTGDSIAELADGGNDLVEAAVSWTLGAEVERLLLTGTVGNSGTGNSQANALTGNAGANSLLGGGGDDTLIGGGGVDTLVGGSGNDSYTVDSTDDVVTELLNEGVDTAYTTAYITLGANVENLVILGTSAMSGVGNAQANALTGNNNLNRLDGGAGADTMSGGDGEDTYVVDNIGDVVTEALNAGFDSVESSISWTLGANVEQLTLTGTASTNASGNALNNYLRGTAGNNRLDGDAGADTMYGGAGNDTYVVDNAADSTIEASTGGTDMVESSISFTLATEVENLTLTGAANVNGTGNALVNTLLGNAGNNRLDGGADVDWMNGGAGNDTYVVDNVADAVIEMSGGGADDVEAAISWTLVAEIEKLTLTGTGNNDATGNGLVNTLIGNAGINRLDGAAGADSMTGGAGNDTFVVDDAGDTTTELASGGTDVVESSVNWTLAAETEKLTLTGTGNNNGTGNASANTLTGNAGNNRLDGAAGIDAMTGGAGNDTYVVDNASDTTVEVASGGTDSVESTISWALGAEVENLTLTGTAANATGNALANVLIGNSGINRISGGVGADAMTGGAGDDTYVVDDVGDTTVEVAAGGIDAVESSINWTLATEVEKLTLTGTGNITGTGNALANTLIGNAGVNRIDGGAGSDAMTGGTGNDTYVVDNAADTTVEAASGGADAVESSISWTLAVEVEALTLTGTENNNATGNASANALIGNAGNNRLNGAAGIDAMTGGSGDDAYVVDNAADTTVESAGGGTDTVEASISWTLSGEVENLTLTGTGAINATGNALSNVLIGNVGVNRIDGGAGIDVMSGSGGNDTYVVDNVGDATIELASEGTDAVESSISWTLATEVEKLTLTGTASNAGTGNASANTLIGNAGSNRLDGGLGADSMTGGAGNDTYVVDNTGDTVTEAASGGTDMVESSVTWTLAAESENLTLTGTGNINGTGNSAINSLVGNAGSNRLDGGAGADVLTGGAGDDTYVVDNVADATIEVASAGTDAVEASLSWTLASELEKLTLTGSAAINATGNVLANTLIGNAGINRLDGTAGADAMTGGAGNDTYVVDDVGDTTIEAAAGGTDAVESLISWSLSTEVEKLTLTGAADIAGTGNNLANTLIGNTGANVLDGGTGNDSLSGGAGNDTYQVDSTLDVITDNASEGTDTVQSSVTWTLGTNTENLTLTGTSAVNGTGNALANQLMGNSAANTLTGNAGNDRLDGAAGADAMTGGSGDDNYVVDNVGDTTIEIAAGGSDAVESSISWTLATEVEKLSLTDAAAINATGNALANTLIGNAGINRLDGAAGADAMTGGAGDDTYVVDNVGDTTIEIATGGTDAVESSLSWTLAAEVEMLTLTGTTAINATGNTLANALIGNAGINRLDGAAGVDTMTGGAGNDTYVVDNASDTTIELAAGGIDTVEASIDWILAAEVEGLTLTGTGNMNGTGNALNNTMQGNAGANVLDGGTGNDSFNGGAGDDLYIVDSALDVVTDNAGEGVDTVASSVGWTLGANTENLALIGVDAVNGTGNSSANQLFGNAASNLLNGGAGDDLISGGAGADTLVGGTGDDAYVVDSALDVVTDNAGEGADTVVSSVSWTLGTNTENLVLIGVDAINGTGNSLVNQLSGNGASNLLNGDAGDDLLYGDAGADTLMGGAGNDTLVGGDGNDRYIGGAGADQLYDLVETSNAVYVWGRGEGADTLTDAGGTDRLDILAGVTEDQIWLRHVGNNLELSVIGTSDSLTISDWYSGTVNQVESFKLADEQALLASQVQQLVDAMAAFAPPAAGQTTLPANYQTALNPVIAPSWA